MKALICQRARELGFDDCRVTTAAAPASAPQLRQWLAEGCHGQMAYLERNAHKRSDPQAVLPGAKSIITLAVNYAVEGTEEATETVSTGAAKSSGARWDRFPRESANAVRQESPLAGLIARYARYDDYHHVLAEPLKRLTELVNQLGGPGTRSLWYVDTGPVLERDLAQRAGLGFIGKHTNVISRKLGNWIFLAQILTTLELEPDTPEQNRCGNCARCLAACPTGAITAPFQLDARLCISYLTIELKGSIPLELRPAIGNRIYGCDDCLAVCPWNRFARQSTLMRTHVRPDLGAPDLCELLSLDEPAFQRRFAGTPMLRAKRRGLLRNVCVALGNSREPSARPALQRAANDPEPLIAEHAHWALEQIPP
jgi:epoxyqueuosine reductase